MSTRKEILEMLSQGQIDVDEATRLLNAVGDETPEELPAQPASGKKGRRWLHIQVSDMSSGKNRVRVNVPLGLVHLGLKVGARFTDEVDDQMMRDVVDALDDPELSGTLVEVEDMEDGERVHIYID